LSEGEEGMQYTVPAYGPHHQHSWHDPGTDDRSAHCKKYQQLSTNLLNGWIQTAELII
jgi:hypothetical protein